MGWGERVGELVGELVGGRHCNAVQRSCGWPVLLVFAAVAAASQALPTPRCHAFSLLAFRPHRHSFPPPPLLPACRLESSSAALGLLKRTSVHHDLFRIWFDGSCGTISGLRLGRTAQQAVEWPEINAAWGQALLLLDTLARVGSWVGGWV